MTNIIDLAEWKKKKNRNKEPLTYPRQIDLEEMHKEIVEYYKRDIEFQENLIRQNNDR